MECWYFFRKFRKAVFGFITLASLLWATVLAVFLVQEWATFSILQRSIVISMIAVNVVTAIMQYLMLVMYFKILVDFVRIMFLLSIHIATSVLFTLFGSSRSCVLFGSKEVCKDFDIGFFVAAWAITGLLLTYTFGLCLMLRVPFPVPLVTPNLLLDSRRSSLASVTSSSALLNKHDLEASTLTVLNVPLSTPQELGRTRPGVQRRLIVVNGSPSSLLGSPLSRPPSHALPERTYGTMESSDFETRAPSPAVVSLRSAGAATSIRQHSLRSQDSRSFSGRRSSQHPVLPLLNPFMDPLCRNGTPDSMYSALTFGSSSSASMQLSGTTLGGSTPDHKHKYPLSTASADAVVTERPKTPESPSSIYSLYSDRGPIVPYDPREGMRKKSLYVPSRSYTSSPHSFHSVAPSVHFQDTRPPPAVHLRAYSDPIYRPYTAGPRFYHPEAGTNTFAVTGGTDVRRFASMGHDSGVGKGVTQASARNFRHLQGALGYTPPRAALGPYGQYDQNTTYAPAVVSKEQWRQLVVAAATSRVQCSFSRQNSVTACRPEMLGKFRGTCIGNMDLVDI
ncbi:hypothetical protein K474DRAFT_19501 [Panus rudis PR-1116 ss-1]|nr:hypothetical protein K474DRAFT_19501 [Panus rudis PR-1116 ss-1]